MKAKNKTAKKGKDVPAPQQVFIDAVVREAKRYAGDEYLSEMLRVGVTERQLPRAAAEFALDNVFHLLTRLTDSEQKLAEKAIYSYFREVIRG